MSRARLINLSVDLFNKNTYNKKIWKNKPNSSNIKEHARATFTHVPNPNIIYARAMKTNRVLDGFISFFLQFLCWGFSKPFARMHVIIDLVHFMD